MIIKNFEQLATTPLRKQALLIAEAGLAAINTTELTEAQCAYDAHKDTLYIQGKSFPLRGFKRVIVVGAGKVVAPAAAVIERKLGNRLSAGIIIDIVPANLTKIESRVGTHPLPSSTNVSATKEITEMLAQCDEHDFILCIIGGGGSSLLCSPAHTTLEEERAITQALMHAGASITEMNTVRKHMSFVKGGGLAKIAYPATVVSLLFSDVPGDDLSQVASGPTVPDRSTMNEAVAVLTKYDILAQCNLESCELIETPKEPHFFNKVTNILFCSSRTSLDAMKRKAHDFGLRVRVWNTAFGGEASVLGAQIVSEIQPGECLIGAGESVVTISTALKHKGSGGRNQEMATAAAAEMPPGMVFAAIASDGHDNSDVAGAIVDSTTAQKIKRMGVSITEALRLHDEYSLLLDAEASVITGITGSNVSDFFVCIKE